MKPIMFVGTGSGVGKSLLTAGYCRLFDRMGVKTAPFKAQNMSLNSGVTAGGLQMSRAQMLQAVAAGVDPDPRMNPILLIPVGDASSVLVRMGKEAGVFSAKEYYAMKEENFKIVMDAYDKLSAEYDLVVLEGAGSPAEINLQNEDIVNMRMADYAGANVVLVGDISRGGVFAALKGTIDLIEDRYRPLVKGMLINKFRGDESILSSGLERMQTLTDKKMLGVIPWFSHNIEEEDSLGDDSVETHDMLSDESPLRVGILWLPRMMSYALHSALRAYRGISVTTVRRKWDLEGLDILIVPESVNVKDSLQYLRDISVIDTMNAFDIYNCTTASVGNATKILNTLGVIPDKTFETSDALNVPQQAQALFDIAGKEYVVMDSPVEMLRKDIDRLADLLEKHTDINEIMHMIQ